jgi:predicted Zn-dependent protease with MMP-like domain
MKLTRAEFESIVRRAVERIPVRFRPFLGEVAIVVRSRPSKKLLTELGLPPGEPLLGLYDGTPRTERLATEPLRYPDTIYLFQTPLEEMCETVDDVAKEVEITVMHELAHYMGIDDERLEELGYG